MTTIADGHALVIRRQSGRRAKRDEGTAAHEVAHGRLGAEVTPAENDGEEAQPPGMSSSKLEGHGDGLVLGEEVLLRQVGVASDLDLQRRMREQVSHPLRVPS